MLSPYLDGITGKIIVSFFQPLTTPDRKDLNGIVGVDLTLDQLADIVKSVKIAETGFAFLSMSNGNVLAVTEQGEKTLGVKINNESGFDRRLAHSNQAAIASLAMPSSAETVLTTLTLKENGLEVPYVVLLKQLDAENLYTGKVPVTREVMSLGFMVPEHEIYASLIAAKRRHFGRDAPGRNLADRHGHPVAARRAQRRLRDFRPHYSRAPGAGGCRAAPPEQGLFRARGHSRSRRGGRGGRCVQPHGGRDQLPHGKPRKPR
jgi:hypothetical protein